MKAEDSVHALATQMTMRDHFAGLAMAALIPEYLKTKHESGALHMLAAHAYDIANAMMDERNQ